MVIRLLSSWSWALMGCGCCGSPTSWRWLLLCCCRWRCFAFVHVAISAPFLTPDGCTASSGQTLLWRLLLLPCWLSAVRPWSSVRGTVPRVAV